MKQLFLTILVMLIFNSTYAQVKATSAEINTGTDDGKFATALALQGSKYLDQNGTRISAVTAAGANTYIASIIPAISAYSLGQVFYIKITTANTGPSTLNLNGLGAKILVKDASTPLIAGDLLANKIYAVSFDGTNFQVMNVTGPQVLSLGITAGNVGISTGNNVTLTSIGNANKPDANNALNAGFYAYTNTSNSTNYPAVLGGGLLFNRAGGTALGQFEFWKSTANNESIFFRTGSGVSTFNPWRIIADRDWATSQFAPITGGGYLPLTGGNLSGTLNINTTINSAYAAKVENQGTTSAHGLYVNIGSASTGVPLIVTKNAAPLFTVNNTGSVIVTGAATARTINVTSADQSESRITISNTSSAGRKWGLIAGVNGASQAGFSIFDYTAGAGTRLLIADDGKIGLGTIAPTERLDVFGNIKATGLIMSSAGVGVDKGYLFRTGTLNRWFVRANNTAESGSNAGADFAISRYNDAGNVMGNALLINRATGNTTFEGTVSAPTFIATTFEGNASTATSATLLSPIPRYTWTHDMLPNDYALGIQTSFVQQATPGGWQSFGSVMTMRGYTGGGGTLQLYTPYGTAYGGNNLQVRFGDYGVNTGNSWTGWKTLMNQGDNAASATKLITPRTINGVSFDGSANITIDAATQASVATLDANAVHKTGNETIAGVKLFSTSVGIGTNSVHSYKLAVGGGIIAESVKVKPQAQWPDYVFEKDYPILPLNELEKFVLKNRHLPNIPNAAEVKKDGIDIGEMNAKLLQKIEELTLYIIEQQKGMMDQQREIKDLRGKVNEMTKLSEAVEKLSADINLIKNK